MTEIQTELQKTYKQNKHLIFTLQGELYGVPLVSVMEVLAITDVMEIPHVPKWFRGLINLRGRIISVIDLRRRVLNCEVEDKPQKTAIVIMYHNGLMVGLVVDELIEVIGLPEQKSSEQFQHASQNSKNSNFVCGVTQKDNNRDLILLLDVDKIVSVGDRSKLRN